VKHLKGFNESNLFTETIAKEIFTELSDKYDDIELDFNPGEQTITIKILKEFDWQVLQELKKDIDFLVHRFLKYHYEEKDEKLMACVGKLRYSNFFSGSQRLFAPTELIIFYVPDNSSNRSYYSIKNHLYLI